MYTGFLSESPIHGDPLEDRGVDWRTVLKRVLKKRDVRMWVGFVSSEKGPVAGSCEHRNEPSDFPKGGKFLDQLGDYGLRKNCVTSC
jgi:hypothetical protein